MAPEKVMAIAVAGHRQRVDREHLIASRAQRPHPQATIGFNPDDHLIGFLHMRRDQLMQLPDPGQSFGQPPRRQPLTALVHQIHIVMLFGPVITDEDHQSPPPRFGCQSTCSSPRAPRGELMDQCSTGTTPHERYRRPHQPAGAQSNPRNRLTLPLITVLTSRRLSNQPPLTWTVSPSTARADRFPLAGTGRTRPV